MDEIDPLRLVADTSQHIDFGQKPRNSNLRIWSKLMAFAMYSDEDGMPYSDYGVYRGIEIGIQRSILSVAERGLWCSNEYELTPGNILLSYDWTRWPSNKEYEPQSREAAITLMLKCADWLAHSIVHEGGFSVWKYNYPFTYNTGVGWKSAHAQAVGLQLLARAANFSGDSQYTHNLDFLLRAFEVPITEGGLSEFTDARGVWYEKIADPKNIKPKILNGMIFAILGLFDVAKIANSALAADLAQRGAQSVIGFLPSFDMGDWSSYDISGKRASVHYHNIHVQQLQKLYSVTNNKSFLEWHKKFAAYYPSTDISDRLRGFEGETCPSVC